MDDAPATSDTLERLFTFVKKITPLLMVAVFGLAIWLLSATLADNKFLEISDYIAGLPLHQIISAVIFTAASYAMLVGYDILALRYVGKSVPLRAVALTSFISYAFTNSVGFGGLGTLTGGSVRYRLYAAAGLSGLEITAVIAFCLVTFFMGVILMGGATLILRPSALAELQAVPPLVVQGIGILMAATVVAYLLWSLLRRRALVIGKWRLKVPPFELALGQATISSLDIVLTCGALYMLMPLDAGFGFISFLTMFIVALIAGIVSHVPGGIGVFEGVLLLLLPNVDMAQAAGALLAYRMIYYMLPLAIAAALLAGHEIYTQRHSVAKVARIVGVQAARVAPQISAIAAFFAGAVLLVSGVTPSIDERLFAIQKVLPLGVLEASHLVGSVTGIGLMLLSRALLQRLDAAYILTLTLLGIGAAASLLKGLDYEEALFLIFLAVALIPTHKAFYRRAVLLGQTFSGQWMALVTVIVTGTIWLGFFSYRHVEYSHALWWQFEFSGDAPRFLRATLAVALIGMGAAAMQLLRPQPPPPSLPSPEDIKRLREIVAASRDTKAALALLGDKNILFNDRGDGFIMYGVRGRTWISMGDPIGPTETRAELAWKFRELCDQYDGIPVFYQVDPDHLAMYVDLGLSMLKLGDEARVDLATFALEGPNMRDLRYGHRRSIKEGATFEVLSPLHVPKILPELRAISEHWLDDHATREKGFSVGHFDESYISASPCAVVRKDGRIIAFTNLWLGAGLQELSVDLMRYTPNQVYGVMDFMFVELLLWGQKQGYQWFNLGMAPLSGLEARKLSPVWYRIGSLAYRFGDQFYNFQGLRKYKEKFNPVWRPKFLASPGGMTLGRVLLDVTALISGGLGGTVRK